MSEAWLECASLSRSAFRIGTWGGDWRQGCALSPPPSRRSGTSYRGTEDSPDEAQLRGQVHSQVQLGNEKNEKSRGLAGLILIRDCRVVRGLTPRNDRVAWFGSSIGCQWDRLLHLFWRRGTNPRLWAEYRSLCANCDRALLGWKPPVPRSIIALRRPGISDAKDPAAAACPT